MKVSCELKVELVQGVCCFQMKVRDQETSHLIPDLPIY